MLQVAKKPTNETRLRPLHEAVELVTGRQLSKQTLNHWAVHGCGGIKLRSCKLGGSRLTSCEAVREFITAKTKQAS